MCDQTETEYLDGDVVWVKLGSCWWPGEVVGADKLPPDVLPSFRKPPIAVVKFFQESTYEYVKNANCIYKYNCSKKNEFINKGLYMYRTKHGHMEKFPEDVIRAETAVGGDIEILTRDEFQEQKKESYAGLFGDSRKTPASSKKGRGRVRSAIESPSVSTPTRKLYKEKSDYKVHILVQPSKEASIPAKEGEKESASTPSTSRAGSGADDKSDAPPAPATPAASSGTYSCPNCSFSTTRLNVLILHNKTHSVSYTPYTPSPARKKSTPKSATKSTPKTSKSPKTPRVPRPKKEKTEKASKKPAQSKKRSAPDQPEPEVKKAKTDEEIKSSLLADWDDDVDEESNDESGLLVTRSPELPVGSESPAAPTSAELPGAAPSELPSSEKKSDETTSDKPEASSSDSKYEFCEDEEWHVEADAGRKIPRVKNPKRKEETTKSLSFDDDDMAKEVAELLNKTAVPELPSVPEPLKVEENFPEPSIVKSPDKKSEPSKSSENINPEPKPTKAIFKTKTFFRSRHSRSQDAIGKYVAEQLNPDRLEMADNELNGSEAVSSPEARESPPIDHVKVARLAPKIQLKKMKAVAAQLERERSSRLDGLEDTRHENMDTSEPVLDSTEVMLPTKPLQDVIYPTQEIKPINKELPSKMNYKEENKDNEFEKLVKTNNKINDPYEIQKENPRKTNIMDTTDSDRESQELSNESPLNNSSTNSIKIPNIANFSLEPEPEPIPAKVMSMLDNEAQNKTVDHRGKKYIRNKQLVNKVEELSPFKVSPQKNQDLPSFETKLSPNTIPEPTEHKVPTPTPTENVIETTPEKPAENIFQKQNSPIKTVTNLQKTYEQLIQPYMSESTASAVDALLSVSRETDRVPKMVGSGPPEDLFEDDKDLSNNDEGMNIISKDNGIYEDQEMEPEKTEERIETPSQDLNGMTNEEPLQKNEKPVQSNEEPLHDSTNQNVDVSMESIDGDQELISDSNKPSESDLQIAETLLNLPSIQKKSNDLQDIVSTAMSVDEQPFEETIPEAGNIVETDDKIFEVEETVNNTEPTPEVILTNNLNMRFETEHEKSENLNAAQSLVQMSESIDHKVNVVENSSLSNKEAPFETKQNNSNESTTSIEQKIQSLSSENNSDPSNGINKSPKYETTSSKLLKILEEPSTGPKAPHKSMIKQTTPLKHVVVTGKEKILNFDVAKSKDQQPKQKIIIRRTGPGKTFLNNFSDVVASPDKIILSRTNVAGQDGSSVQTFTIQAPPEKSHTVSDPKQIIIQPKVRKIAKTPTKVQKMKPQNSLVQWPETKTSQTAVTDETMFDINSMPVVLSDDILTPESIEKMPIVMTDGNIISNTASQQNIIQTPHNPLKIIKTPKPIENEKVAISASPSKSEVKTLLMNPVTEVNKTTTPNILSKSAKLRGAKPMLVIDKATGKQKIIMTKAEPAVKEIKQAPTLIQPAPQPGKQAPTLIQPAPQPGKQAPTLIQPAHQPGKQVPTLIQPAPQPGKQAPTLIQPAPQPGKQAPTLIQPAPQHGKTEKFIFLPTGTSPRTGRTQKIVIDPLTGKAHVLIAKGQETPTISVPENKPVSAKLIPSSSDASSPGNTVMIITNAQGAQSRIVLTPEHEKILFPNKQQPNVSQLKTITQRMSTNATLAQKSVVSVASPVKAPTRIVPKQQKSAIITSKGQLIVGGRVTTTAQNIAPMPEIRPAPKPEVRAVPKRIVASEPKKLVQAIQKTTSEPLIFLQQKSGEVMQLTTAQFEHLQRTGQIVQKPPQSENKIVVQKSVTLTPKEAAVPQKQRVRKTAMASPTPAKRVKQQTEIAIAPAPTPVPPVPPLTSFSHTIPPVTPSISTIIPPSISTIIPPSISTIIPSVSNTISVSTSSSYSDLDNFEELLPSTAIVKQTEPAPAVVPPPETVMPQPVLEPVAEPPPAQLSDGQLLAVPGENFGGPPGSFYLCVEDNGTLTPIDNRPLVLENNQLVPMAFESLPVFAPQPERQDILQAALANSDVFHGEASRDEAPDFRDLNANVSVHCRVSETSTTLNQPIMTPVEVPTEGDSKPTVPSNLEDGLAIIGVTPHTVPTTLELPITVTDPRIAPKTTDPLSNSNYGTALLTSPNTDMPFVATEETEVTGPISMPLLTDEESVGKSMPILTDEVTERTVSSIESTTGSPSSIDVRESEAEEGGQWTRRLLTPGTDISDISEASAEIPLQPAIQLSVNDLSRHS